MPAPALARPVFSTEDSRLIRRAVVEFIKNNQDENSSAAECFQPRC